MFVAFRLLFVCVGTEKEPREILDPLEEVLGGTLDEGDGKVTGLGRQESYATNLVVVVVVDS